MKILIVTPQAPYPPRQGTTIRNYNLIRGLAQRHEVDLLTFLAPGEVVVAGNPLLAHCRRVTGVAQPVRRLSARARDTLRTLTPDMGLRLESTEMHRLIRDWTQATRYDIVQIEGIELAQYGMAVAGRGDPARPVLVFDNHNCEYLLQQRNALTDLRQPRRWPAAAYSLIQWQKLRRYEAAVMRASAAVIAVSVADRTALQKLGAETPITVVSNGIDLDAYRPPPRALTPAPTIVFTGKMDYRPNIDAVLWFAQAVLPRVLAQAPAARFQIVGMNPHPRLDPLRRHPAIEITGAVEDTRAYIHGAAAYLIPMRVGGGTRFKALEAMACGAAIVSTSLGVEGLGIRHAQEMLLADAPDDFAAAVVRLLPETPGSAALRAQLGAQGRRYVEAHYDWAQIIPKLEALLQATQADNH